MNGRTSPAAPDCIKVRSPRYAIDRIVIHAQDGTQAGTEAWFKKPGRTPPTAAHYLIGRDGAVVQMVPDDRKAIHAGSPTEAGWNDRSIGLEFEVRCNPWEGRAHFPLNDWTPAMLDAGAEVTAILCTKFWIPANRVHIVGHSEVPGATHTDPGPAFPWDTFMAAVVARMGA